MPDPLACVRTRCFGFIWLIANVHIVITSGNTSSASLIVQQRPRALGRRLTIELDATVAFVDCSGRSTAQNSIRMLYGTRGKQLHLRLPSALERQRWMEAIAAAVGTPVHAMTIHPRPHSRFDAPSKAPTGASSELVKPQLVRIAQPAPTPIRLTSATMPAKWSLREYCEAYIIAAAPHPTELARSIDSSNWCNQQLPTKGLLYTNARGITFEPNCC